MTLRTIIIRAEGALAEVEDVRRAAFARVFAEAGFDWTIDRAGFANTAPLGDTIERISRYVRQALKGRPETADISLLINAMHRRSNKLFTEMIVAGEVAARPLVRDLAAGARAEGLRMIVASALSSRDTEALVVAATTRRIAAGIEIVCRSSVGEADVSALYEAVSEQLPGTNNHALVIEATAAGGEAARNAGFPVFLTRSPSLPFGTYLAEGSIVLDSLYDLMPGPAGKAIEPLKSDQREELLAALHRLHLGNCKERVQHDRSTAMRVGDILKTKGSAVKTIEPGATIQALALGLRAEAVGAMPVVDNKGMLHGIISERDLARGVAQYGPDLSTMRVSDLMTRAVVTCHPEDGVAAVAGVMTQRRIRHLPVVVNGALVGLISIGDVLKHRLDEVQLEASVLRDFALTRR